MERRTSIFVICSPRPRVGKTLLARALTDYFRAEERPVAAFDVNPDDFALASYLPGHTAVASIDDIRGEMALFDQLLVSDGASKVVDLSHGQFDRFFAVIREIAFFEEARRRAITPVVLFVADPDARSRHGYAMLRDRFPGLALVPVINQAVAPLARYHDAFEGTRSGGRPIHVPLLPPFLKGVIERPSFSFAAFSVTAADTTTELYGWTRRMFVEFRELEIRLLLAQLKPQLKFSA